MGSSLSKSHLPRNYWPEETGQVSTYAEYVSVPVELVARKPASLTHAQAAAGPLVGITAGLALSRAHADRERSIFVAAGAGGVGTFAIMLARQLGVRNVVTTAGSARSRAYLIQQCGLGDDQIVDYTDGGFIVQAMKRNGGRFDIALDLVGGTMLSACCALLKVEGNLASVTDAPSKDDFEIMFQKNASFHSIGAHAYSLTGDRTSWRKYRQLLDDLSRHFDSGELAPMSIRVLGVLSPQVVRRPMRCWKAVRCKANSS